MFTAVDDVFGDADLFQVFLARVGMVGVDDDGRIGQVTLAIGFVQALEVFIVIVRHAVAEAVDIAAQDGVLNKV